METLTRWPHGSTSGDHGFLPERSWVEFLLLRWHTLAAKPIRSHRTDPAPHVWVAKRSIDVGEPPSPRPDCRNATAIVVMNVRDVDNVHARPATTIPGVESVAW